jgi:hypothetical protein
MESFLGPHSVLIFSFLGVFLVPIVYQVVCAFFVSLVEVLRSNKEKENTILLPKEKVTPLLEEEDVLKVNIPIRGVLKNEKRVTITDPSPQLDNNSVHMDLKRYIRKSKRLMDKAASLIPDDVVDYAKGSTLSLIKENVSVLDVPIVNGIVSDVFDYIRDAPSEEDVDVEN